MCSKVMECLSFAILLLQPIEPVTACGNVDFSVAALPQGVDLLRPSVARIVQLVQQSLARQFLALPPESQQRGYVESLRCAYPQPAAVVGHQCADGFQVSCRSLQPDEAELPDMLVIEVQSAGCTEPYAAARAVLQHRG